MRTRHVFYFLFCTGHVRGHLNFHGIAITFFDIVFMFKIFNKIIDMDDYRWISWYQSFVLGPFHQPEQENKVNTLCYEDLRQHKTHCG